MLLLVKLGEHGGGAGGEEENRHRFSCFPIFFWSCDGITGLGSAQKATFSAHYDARFCLLLHNREYFCL